MIVQGNDPYTQPSFGFMNRFARQAWGIVWVLFFRPSPRPLHMWRRILLRLFGAKLGRHVHVYPSARVWAPWNLEIGNFVGVGDGANLYSMAKITIADYTVISQGTHLCAGSHDFETPNFQLIAAPIKIGSRVWLCTESFVGPGVTIPDGNVIGARSVVSKSLLDEWCVWAGVPVRKIRARDKNKVLQ